MDLKKFYIEIAKLGLSAVWNKKKGEIAICAPSFKNPIIIFDALADENACHRKVDFKSMNAPLFTEKQINYSLHLVKKFLNTPLKERGVDYLTAEACE